MSEIATLRDRVANVRALLEKSRPQIELALPKHVTADRMLRVVMTCVQKNPRLLMCTPVSLIGAIIQASQLGLEPDVLGARAYLIPRRNRRKDGEPLEANFQVGYLGLLDLARRSRQVATFEAREVFEGDVFRYHYGLRPMLLHAPCGETDDAKITHVYAVCRMTNGRAQYEVMTRGQVDAHRLRYSATTSEDSAWLTSWPAMAKKTVAIRLCKFLPASVEMASAVALVEADEAGVPQDTDVLASALAVQEAGRKSAALDQLADGLEHHRSAPGAAPESESVSPGEPPPPDAGQPEPSGLTELPAELTEPRAAVAQSELARPQCQYRACINEAVERTPRGWRCELHLGSGATPRQPK